MTEGHGIRAVLTCHDQGIRMRELRLAFSPDELTFEKELNRVCVHERIREQTLVGFGGAFTQASAYVFHQLKPEMRHAFLEACFSSERGLGYTFCRTHFGSCDFSTHDYVAMASKGEAFSMREETEQMIPMIQQAQGIASALKLIASPWSPPAWMKDNDSRTQGGHLKREYYELWAECLAQYLAAYRAAGLNICAITPQNECAMRQVFESCIYSPGEEAEFIETALIPALKRWDLDPDILIWDYNKHLALEHVLDFMEQVPSQHAVSGVALHWYSGDHFEVLDALRNRFPKLALYLTEACTVATPGQDRVSHAIAYAHEIIGDLNHGVSAFMDWNLLLDERGGPNHLANYCNAPIQVIEGELCFMPTFDYLAHISRFIRPGAVRLCTSRYTEKIDAMAWENTDGVCTAVILNPACEEKPVLFSTEHGICDLRLPGRSIMTLVY